MVNLIGSKLRRGDPFTEQITDWNPPDHKDRRKKINKKTNVPTQVCNDYVYLPLEPVF